ncbi:MAG: pyridoxal phosphate-dependent aminotransferase [Candidatus Krumholzibacteriia bacterium]
MPQRSISDLDFGDRERTDRSLSEQVRNLVGSEILKIAADIRQRIEAGHTVCNLTVGDFEPRNFPIPETLSEGIQTALAAGETNYPPSDGVETLRQAVAGHVAREWGVRYPVESILIAGGARPILYATYRCVLNPGEKVVYPVPSWNNNHYTWLAGASGVAVPTRMEDGFMPTLDLLAPHLGDARLLCLNSPLNPTGTVIEPEQLRAIVEAVVQENRKRTAQGRRHLFLLYDSVYGSLIFGDAKHHVPPGLVPESAPWVVCLDGVSKAFAATGLRVGWVLAAPTVTARMKDFLGHVGAWAPRAEQVAVAAFLGDTSAVENFKCQMAGRVRERLEALHEGFSRMQADDYPVDCVNPQGAIYLSLRIDVIGRKLDGDPIEDNETLRKLLLARAGFAVVPFQAFGLDEETGWFRISVGAVSLDEIRGLFPRFRHLLDLLD